MASKFAEAFAKKAKARWAETKKAKARQGGGFGPVDIPDGSYVAIVSSRCQITTKATPKCPVGTLITEFECTIASGTHEGQNPKKSYFLKGEKPRLYQGEPMPTAEDELIGDLKVLCPDLIADIEKSPQLAAEVAEVIVNQRQPKVRIGIKTKPDKKDPKKMHQSVYFNSLLQGDTSDATQEESSEEETGEEDAEAEEGGETEEGEGELVEEEVQEEEFVAPAKGDSVGYQVKGSRVAKEFEVQAVQQRAQTVTLIDSKGKLIKAVPWADLLIEEEAST